jgi:hypothetical protein
MENITKDAIHQRAFDIYKSNKSFDQLCWLLAEMELKLQAGQNSSPDNIRKMAQSIANQKPSLQNLHWLLAEKQLLVERKLKK